MKQLLKVGNLKKINLKKEKLQEDLIEDLIAKVEKLIKIKDNSYIITIKSS